MSTAVQIQNIGEIGQLNKLNLAARLRTVKQSATLKFNNGKQGQVLHYK